jgi:hypothetical protein
MDQRTGWIAAVIVIGVLLVGALVILGVVLATNGDDGSGKAGSDQISVLEEKVGQLETQVDQANADAAAARQQASTQAASGSSSSGSGPSGSSGTGNQAQVEALALAIANGNLPEVAWQVGETVIDGNWARVSVGCPSDHTVQGECLYFHKVGGSWQYVTCGTGLCYGDIPGAPASIFP